jgi:peptidoglycan/LPS O-acetylase OafA/YrhL
MQPAEPGRLLVVEYLRGIASLSVAWFHLTNSYKDSWVASSGSYGWLGVEIFFVISGFVIPYSIWKVHPNYSIKLFPQFLARRILRLEPPYLVSLALVILLHYISSSFPWFRGETPSYDFLQIASHVFYLVPLTGYDWVQPVYWSLAYEFVFYVSIGLTYWLVSGARNTVICLTASTVLASAVLLEQLPSRMLLFVIGVTLFRNAVGFQDSRIGISVIAICSFIIGCTGGPEIALTGLVAAAAIYWGMRFEVRGNAGNALLLCGAISYSLYLVHVPIGGRVVNLGRRLVDGPVQELFLSLFALAVALGFATIFYIVVEKPFVRRSRRLSASRTAVQSVIP